MENLSPAREVTCYEALGTRLSGVSKSGTKNTRGWQMLFFFFGCMTHKKSDVGQAGSTMADGVINAVIELAGLRVLHVTYFASPLDSGHFVST